MAITTHLILLSGQKVPNITPVLDDSFKPKHVVMLVSSDMYIRADWLKSVYKKRGIKCSRYHFEIPFIISC